MTKQEKKQAYSMHVDGRSPKAIAAELGVPIDEVLALLGEKSKPAKPAPPVTHGSGVDPDCEGAADMHAELKRRLRGGGGGGSLSGIGSGGGGYSDPDRAARGEVPKFRPPGGGMRGLGGIR